MISSKKKKWDKARKLLLRQIKKYQNNAYLLTHLSYVYYNERKYNKSLTMSRKHIIMILMILSLFGIMQGHYLLAII